MTPVYSWQQPQWQQCVKAQEQQRLHHGLLLTGSRGLGKLDFAKRLAAFRLCDAPSEQACGQCRSCELLKLGHHPDYFICQPEEKSKVIKVDQIRSLTAKLHQTAQREHGQVVIIEPAEAMNTAASNALLKTLEEPSGHVLIVLVAHRLLTIPATISSRCQRLAFSVAEEEQAKQWLASEVSSTEQLDLAWRLSSGAPLLALQMLNDEILEYRDDILNHMGRIHQRKQDPIAVVAQWVKKDVLAILQMILSISNDVLSSQQSVAMQYLTHQDQQAKLSYLARKLSAEKVMKFQAILLDRINLWQRAQSINPQLLLECVMCEWSEVENVS